MAKPNTRAPESGRRGNSCGQPWVESQSEEPRDSVGWLEIERREGSVTVSRDHWIGPTAVFMLSGARSARKPKSRSRARGQSVRSSEEASNDRGAKGRRKGRSVNDESSETKSAAVPG